MSGGISVLNDPVNLPSVACSDCRKVAFINLDFSFGLESCACRGRRLGSPDFPVRWNLVAGPGVDSSDTAVLVSSFRERSVAEGNRRSDRGRLRSDRRGRLEDRDRSNREASGDSEESPSLVRRLLLNRIPTGRPLRNEVLVAPEE